MRYFTLGSFGNGANRSLAFISSPPKGIGLYDYCMRFGEAVGDRYPEDPRIYLEAGRPGIKLASFIGNTVGYLIVCAEMKDAILGADIGEIETLPFKLYNHKNRLHSEDYWIVNPIGSFDCVNRAASDIEYLDASQKDIVAVTKFVLNANKLNDAPDLFRVPEKKDSYFVSERLARLFLSKGFTNIMLKEVALAAA